MNESVRLNSRTRGKNSALRGRFFIVCLQVSRGIFICLLALLGAGCLPQGVKVEWTTATEERTAGFNLFRSETADGNFAKINSQLIPASTNPLHGAKYQYQDTAADPSRTYYYKLEEVEDSGDTRMYGPIVVTGESGVDPTIWLVVGIGIVIIGGLFYFFRRKNG